MSVKYGVLQASLLGHILFSLYYYYLRHICESDEKRFFMFADDTTIYTIDKTHDLVSQYVQHYTMLNVSCTSGPVIII
jgi:uncharacterized protein YqhQ